MIDNEHGCGVVIYAETDRIVAERLSTFNSPRVHGGAAWINGAGGLIAAE